VAAAQADQRKEAAVLAAAVAVLLPQPEPQELLILVVEVGELDLAHQQLVVTAAPASLSSSTTSALPQSSPSSHRRSGLRQRVR
jgi:hypothetical protein